MKQSYSERRARAPKGELPLLQLSKWLKSRTIRWGLIVNAAIAGAHMAELLPTEYAVPVATILNAVATIINRVRTVEPLSAKK